jgi:hypothetical protein
MQFFWKKDQGKKCNFENIFRPEPKIYALSGTFSFLKTHVKLVFILRVGISKEETLK